MALAHDPGNQAAISGYEALLKMVEKQPIEGPAMQRVEHAIADTEIQEIMKNEKVLDMVKKLAQQPEGQELVIADPELKSQIEALRFAGLIR
jgi:hypothetical protein